MQELEAFFAHRWHAFAFLQGQDLASYVRDATEYVKRAQTTPVFLAGPGGGGVAIVLSGPSKAADILPIDDSSETLRVLAQYDWDGLARAEACNGGELRGLGVAISRHWDEPPPRFQCTNVQMEKELSPLSLQCDVVLEPQSERERADMIAEEIPNYAREQQRISPDLSFEEAMRRSRKTFEDAAAKENNHFLKIVRGKDSVGVLWIIERSPASFFVGNVRIFDAFQGIGLGKIGMQLAETFSLEKGAAKLALHVFGHNTRARRLYERLGYRTVGEFWKRFEVG